MTPRSKATTEWERLCEREQALQISYSKALKAAGGRDGENAESVRIAEQAWKDHQALMRDYLRTHPV